jgi:ATP-binding cassette subfamily B protein
MHRGELRESGTHQELLAMRGIYHRLYQLQFKVEKVEEVENVEVEKSVSR